MPAVADAVKAERLAKAQKWMAEHEKTDELFYSTATGYYVPKEYRSKGTKEIKEDETILNLMKAQGYKPRAKKEGETSSSSDKKTEDKTEDNKTENTQPIVLGTQVELVEKTPEPETNTNPSVLEKLVNILMADGKSHDIKVILIAN